MTGRAGLVATLALLLSVATAEAAPAPAPARWIASWRTVLTPALPPGPGVPQWRASPVLDNQTLVQEMRLSAGGRQVRINLSNEFGEAPLGIAVARVSVIPSPGAAARADRQITFSGRPSVTLAPGAQLSSDPIDLAAPDLATLRISLYVPGRLTHCSCHAVGLQLGKISPPGDFTRRNFPVILGTENRALISGLDVAPARPVPVVVALGDSITDGFGSSSNANRRWPDRLAERLAQAGGGAVVNAGITGNALLRPMPDPLAGDSALARFDRDVLAVPGATHVIVLEGINDFIAGGYNPPRADALITGYQKIIQRAHARRLKVIGATLLPWGGSTAFELASEGARQRVNAWIRTSHAFDGVVDFEAAVRDPRDPLRIRPDLQSGDGIHPNDQGYRLMADAIDLKLFR